MLAVVVESPVKNPNVPYAVCMNDLYSFPYGIYRNGTDRLFSSAYAEGTCIETSPCCLKLNERFTPIEEDVAAPYYCILHEDLSIGDVFIPEKALPDLTTLYLRLVSKKFKP